MTAVPLVSVIIPTHNRAQMLCDCVSSVLTSDWPDLEVIVADDCSPDDTARQVSERFGNDERVKYVRTERNGFTSAARNCGARIALGSYLLFIDDDNELLPDAIREMVACFRRNPKAQFVAPLTLHWKKEDGGSGVTAFTLGMANRSKPNGGNHTVWTLGSDYNPWTSMCADYYPQGITLDTLPPAPAGGCDFPTTYSPNAFMVPKNTFLQVHGFDEGYGMQYDEADFGVRITKGLGAEGYICAKAVTKHLGFLDPAEVGELRAMGLGNPGRAYCFGRNRVKFARRHFNWLQALSVALVFAPLSALWYGRVALRNHRADIAWGYFKGTVAGILGIYRSKFFDGNPERTGQGAHA
jgi:glycosyltransferase involved in cell wall biosynthesis